MGGKTQSDTANSTTTNTSNESNSVGVGGDNSGILLSGNKGDIELIQTDHGSIESAFEFGDTALNEAFGFGSDALNALNESNEAALSFANSVNASKNTEGASDIMNSKFLVIGAVGVVLVLILLLVMGRR